MLRLRPARRRRPEPPRRALRSIRKRTILIAAVVLLAGVFFAGALDVFSSARKSDWQPQISPMGAIARAG